jgi:hypothetical protein
MKSSTELSRTTAPEKKGSRHNPQHDGWLIHGFIPSFSLEPTNEAVGVKLSICWRRLLGLPGSYHRHAISTFNTCSRGPTHRFLTNTGGGYNLGGADLPHTTPQPSQSVVSTFPEGPCLVSILIKFQPLNQNVEFKKPMAATWSSDHLAIYHNLHLCLAIANDLSLVIGGARIDWKVVVM